MQTSTVHNPDHYMADLRQVLSQGRKRIGLFVGAGAPTAVRINEANQIVPNGGQPLVPDVESLTTTVIATLCESDQQIVEALTADTEGPINIETILTKTRRLAQVIGGSAIHGLDGDGYDQLAKRICERIGREVSSRLPSAPNPYSNFASWIGGTQRLHSVEVFTPNYDLLMEEAFERARIPFFDGFTGSHKPFFDPVGVLSDDLPARWSRLWKLHGSLGWRFFGDSVIRTGDRNATELIYPDHLKYDQVTRLPYSALFERLRHFLTTPDTLMLCSGFSFSDSHICAVMDESLAANAHTAILAFQYKDLSEEQAAVGIAQSRPNISVYARDGAVINGVVGPWRPGRIPGGEWETIRRTFWQPFSSDGPEAFLLGDFAILARFLALIQARQIGGGDGGPEDGGGVATQPVTDVEP